MQKDVIENFAIRVALGNNGGSWATHYTEDQKEHWRQFIRDLIRDLPKDPPWKYTGAAVIGE